jgi:hypothetical protein
MGIKDPEKKKEIDRAKKDFGYDDKMDDDEFLMLLYSYLLAIDGEEEEVRGKINEYSPNLISIPSASIATSPTVVDSSRTTSTTSPTSPTSHPKVVSLKDFSSKLKIFEFNTDENSFNRLNALFNIDKSSFLTTNLIEKKIGRNLYDYTHLYDYKYNEYILIIDLLIENINELLMLYIFYKNNDIESYKKKRKIMFESKNEIINNIIENLEKEQTEIEKIENEIKKNEIKIINKEKNVFSLKKLIDNVKKKKK